MQHVDILASSQTFRCRRAFPEENSFRFSLGRRATTRDVSEGNFIFFLRRVRAPPHWASTDAAYVIAALLLLRVTPGFAAPTNRKFPISRTRRYPVAYLSFFYGKGRKNEGEGCYTTWALQNMLYILYLSQFFL